MINRIKHIAALTALAVTVAVAAPAQAQSLNMGALADFLPEYTEEAPWREGIVNDVFRMENTSDVNSSNWYYTGLDRSGSKPSVSVDVRIVQGHPEYSHAGLLYGFTDKNAVRFFYTVEAGRVSLFEIGNGNSNAIMVTETDAVKDGWNTLKITEVDGMIELEINGKNIGGIGNDHTGKGGVGIVAWGTGGFEFRNFKSAS